MANGKVNGQQVLPTLAVLEFKKLSNPGPREAAHTVSTPQRAHEKKGGIGLQLLRAPRRALQQTFLLLAHLGPCQATGTAAPGKTQTPILLFAPVLLSPDGFLILQHLLSFPQRPMET